MKKLLVPLIIALLTAPAWGQIGVPVGGSGGGGAPSGPAGGDLAGTYPNPTVGTNAVTNAKSAQMANSTVKCRTTAGTGNPEDCTATQAAAILAVPGGLLKSCTISSSRDLTTATGTQAITGCGFQPTSCIGNGSVAASITQYITIVAVSDSARNMFNTNVDTSVIATGTGVFFNFQDSTGGNLQQATIQSYDADGLTLSWTKTGTPTGTATFRMTCYR